MQSKCILDDILQMGAYRSRTLEYFFKEADGQFPVLLVTGARQVGKTTFVQHVRNDDRTYVTLGSGYRLMRVPDRVVEPGDFRSGCHVRCGL